MRGEKSRIDPYAVRAERRRNELTAALDRIVVAARSFPDVVAVWVYGSLARGTVGPASDLDLLVVRNSVLRGPARGEDFVERALPGVAFDLTVLTPQEFAAARMESPFWRAALADALCAYAA